MRANFASILVALAAVSCLAATAADAVTIEGLRSAALKAAEKRMGACGIIAADPSENPIPQFASAEKVYWRVIRRNGQEYKYVVGAYGRSKVKIGQLSYGTRDMMTANGNIVGQIGGDNPSAYLNVNTNRGGIQAHVNQYYTADRWGRMITDFNGYCGGEPFRDLVRNKLEDELLRCLDLTFGVSVARAMCNYRATRGNWPGMLPPN